MLSAILIKFIGDASPSAMAAEFPTPTKLLIFLFSTALALGCSLYPPPKYTFFVKVGLLDA